MPGTNDNDNDDDGGSGGVFRGVVPDNDNGGGDAGIDARLLHCDADAW